MTVELLARNIWPRSAQSSAFRSTSGRLRCHNRQDAVGRRHKRPDARRASHRSRLVFQRSSEGHPRRRHTIAVEIGGLRPDCGERRKRARIFGALVETGARQKPCLAVLNPPCHTESIELNLVQPFRPGRGRFNKLRELGRYPLRER
jgi:hypothetical protein